MWKGALFAGNARGSSSVAIPVVGDVLQQDLERAIAGDVRFDRLSRALYSTDASVYQIEPRGVVLPRSIEDVQAIVEIASRHGTSITARGGGTSQAGQAVGSGLQLDTSKYFNRLLAIDPSGRSALVEPGIVLDELNAALRPHGLRFAPDISTASRATIGGMIANNSSGARSVLYGKTIDHVIELDVVLADGRVAHLTPVQRDELPGRSDGDTIEARGYRTVARLISEFAGEIERRFPKVLRRVGGYNLDEFIDPSRPFNLAKLFVGSEGTLGIVVSAKLNLVPLPKAKAVLAIEFDELLDALAATPVILRHRPSAVEVMDRFILDHTRESPALDALRRRILQQESTGALLCVELYGDDAAELPQRLASIEADLAGLRCRWRRAVAPEDQARIWSLREAALGLSMAMKGDGKSLSFVEDTAVAPEKLRDYIDRFLTIVRAHGTVAGVYAHASVGCLHVRPVVNLKTAEGVRRFESIAGEISDLVLEYGGALSGEHGDGLVRGPFTAKMFGPTLYEAFRTVKRTFDPNALFNPGKIVDAPPMTANLRYGAGYATKAVATHFDFADYGGFGQAAEMCSGVGACRKTIDGTMCPSYMVTRDEKHSTRGRANVLRLAMAGNLKGSSLSDDDLRDVLDLCLECRACKTECPVGVDVARLKSEFLAGYWNGHPIPLGTRVLARAHSVAKWGSRLAPLSNAVGRAQLVRRLGEAAFRIDRRRLPPRWARTSFSRRFAARKRHHETGPRVTIFNDTFTNYCDPEIGVAAVDVLEAAGRSVALAGNACCGRPQISQGLLDEARQCAESNVKALYSVAAEGGAIVFLEPSCLSAVKEDAPALLVGEAKQRARVVAGACCAFEEYVERELAGGRAQLPMTPGPSRIVFHGHCHQKAMGLAAPALALLSRIPSAAVEALDAGCCGMAGSFGYVREHYDVSRQIGERRLLPAARGLKPGAVLVASGTSCRQQVAHFAGVEALHPAVIIGSLLDRS